MIEKMTETKMTKPIVVPSVVFVENKNQLIQQHEVRRRTKKDDAFAVV